VLSVTRRGLDGSDFLPRQVAARRIDQIRSLVVQMASQPSRSPEAEEDAMRRTRRLAIPPAARALDWTKHQAILHTLQQLVNE